MEHRKDDLPPHQEAVPQPAMHSAAVPPSSYEALRRTGLLDSPVEKAFDRLTELACCLLDVPVALISLIDEDRQFFKSLQGLPEPWASQRETPRSHSFCQHVVSSAEPLIVEDARRHPLVCDNPAIRDLNVIGYLGFPLATPEGTVIGSFCAIDTKPRAWTANDLKVLSSLAASVTTEIAVHVHLREREQTEVEREQALAAEQHRAAQLQALAKAAADISATQDLEAKLQLITERARTIIGTHQGVTSMTIDQDWAHAINTVSLSDKYAAYQDYRQPPDGLGIYAEVCRTNRPMRMTQAALEAHPAWRGFGREAANHPPLRGWLAVPLVSHTGQNLGLIQLSDKYEGAFTESDEAILLQMAHIASEQIESARAEQALRESETRLRILNETLEQRVLERTKQVRTLSRALTLAEQRERRHLSQVLHDDLQQVLFGLEMRTKLLIRSISTDQTALQERAEDLRTLINEAIHTTRTLSIELNPPVLRGEGLGDAFSWLAAHMKEMHQLTVELHVQGNIKLRGEDWRVLLVQFVRELLFNVVKHAGVDRARVTVFQTNRELCIRVEDEGKGFDVQAAVEQHAHQDALGLFSIEERLRLLGGHLEIASSPDAGTRITIRIPHHHR